VLYQSGIGYVEREGSVSGGEIVLHVQPDQINDLMASLVVRDKTSNDLASISLPLDPSTIPSASPLPPELESGSGMLAALRTLRGANVQASTDEGRVRGRVMGVETIGGAEVVTIVVDGERLQAIPIAKIRAVDLLDGALSVGIGRALDASLSSGHWKSVALTIRFADDRSRQVALSYLVEMPTWRPIYRAVVDRDAGLQFDGYAVVDNTSGESWNDVRLSLTAGTPISFRYDLRTPVQPERPDMSGYGMLETGSLAPPTPLSAGGFSDIVSGQGMGAGSTGTISGYGGSASVTRSGSFSTYGAAPMAKAGSAPSSVFVGEPLAGESAEGVDVGALFRYDIRVPITVPNGSSVLVPIVHTRLEGADALIYQPGDQAVSQSHPYRALHLKNSSGVPIQPAPITVYSDSAYAGSAIAPYIGVGESAVVPFGIENDVRIRMEESQRSGSLRLVRIVSGTLDVETQTTQASEYRVSSVLQDAASLFVVVPRIPGWELKLPEGATSEIRDENYLIEMEVKPASTQTFVVEQTTRTSMSLLANAPQLQDVIAGYLSSADARPDVARKLGEVQARLVRVGTIETELQGLRRVRADLQNRTQELRSNLGAIRAGSVNESLRRTLTERLETAERELDRISGRLVESQEEQSRLRIEASELLSEITLQAEP
jgi:hypothetical protein